MGLLTRTHVAHALVRAVFALLRTPSGTGKNHFSAFHSSVNLTHSCVRYPLPVGLVLVAARLLSERLGSVQLSVRSESIAGSRAASSNS